MREWPRGGGSSVPSRREDVSSALSFASKVDVERAGKSGEEPPAPSRKTHTTAAQQRGAAVIVRARRRAENCPKEMKSSDVQSEIMDNPDTVWGFS